MRSAWNEFVSKIFKEGKQKNPNYQFKDALKDASKRKGEMGKPSSSNGEMMSSKNKMKRTKRNKKSQKKSKKSNTKKSRKH
jgi:hypothetical protein